MSYEEELKALFEWWDHEGEKLEASHDSQPGFDDWLMYARRPLLLEVNRRWAELREKYGIPEPEPKGETPTPRKLSDEELLEIFKRRS